MDKHYLIKRQFFISNKDSQIKDQYQFLKEVGRGAYGTVYLVRLKIFPHFKRVIKVISKKKIKNPTYVLNEIRAMGKLDHPRIVKLYETFEDQNYLYLVLDFCAGQQLYDKLSNISIFSEKTARYLFRQMANTIKYLHGEKIVHRDLKLENFMMEDKESWEIRLIDFGLSFAWIKDMKKELKKEQKKIIGTSYYISPEVMQFCYDERCDVWSLGVILYMMVTGRPPFDGQNQQEIYAKIKKVNYSLKTPECQQLSPNLLDLIFRILQPEKNRLPLDGILAHPWLTVQSMTVEKPLKIQFTRLRQFACYSKLKKIVATYLATNLSQNQIQILRQTFLKIDRNNDGYLSIEQFHKYLNQDKDELMPIEKLEELMNEIDSDCNGKINYNEFISSCIDQSVLASEDYLKYVFNAFDLNRDGGIQREEFNTILRVYSQQFKCNLALVEALINQNDNNKDGVIDFEQFMASIKHISKLSQEIQSNSIKKPNI